MKKNSLLSSSKFRIAVLSFLIIITLILVYLIYFNKKNSPETDTISIDTNKRPPDSVTFDPQTSLSNSIDSILFTFGIKKEWITTEIQKKQGQKAEWFIKTVTIPKDLTTVEVNLDISSFLNAKKLGSKVNENIFNKDITISINNPDTAKQLPAAIIQINHSDKAIRETGVIAVIIDKINTFSSDDIEKFIVTKNEFSYIFPRNLDDIEIQNKLQHYKKDIVINLTYAGPENYEADFNSAMDEKNIREKIKSFIGDYSSVNKVLLTRPQQEPALNTLRNKISAELIKFNIRVINDSMITNAFNPNEKDRLNSFFNILVQKANLSRIVIAIYPADKNEFEDFYNRIMVYKKLGYKFLNLSDYFIYIENSKQREKELEEKRKQEDMKKKKPEDNKKKKSEDVKVPPQKESDKKSKTEKPKQQPKKQPEKKKK